MPETYSNLSKEDRLYALKLAQDQGQYRAFLLEKDNWVVASLSMLFDALFEKHLTFKGDTPLSKVGHFDRLKWGISTVNDTETDMDSHTFDESVDTRLVW